MQVSAEQFFGGHFLAFSTSFGFLVCCVLFIRKQFFTCLCISIPFLRLCILYVDYIVANFKENTDKKFLKFQFSLLYFPQGSITLFHIQPLRDGFLTVVKLDPSVVYFRGLVASNNLHFAWDKLSLPSIAITFRICQPS